jgi:hypothetical protein
MPLTRCSSVAGSTERRPAVTVERLSPVAHALRWLGCAGAVSALSGCGVDGSLRCGVACDPDASLHHPPGHTLSEAAVEPIDGSVADTAPPLDDQGGPEASPAAAPDGSGGDGAPEAAADASPDGVAPHCQACGGVMCCDPQQCVGSTCCNGAGASCSGGCCSSLVCSTAALCVVSCKTSGTCSGQNDCCRAMSYCDATGHCAACLAPMAACASNTQCCNGRCLSSGTCATDT